MKPLTPPSVSPFSDAEREGVYRAIYERRDGVIPHLSAIGLDEEDSVALEDRRTVARAWRDAHAADANNPHRPLRVGVIALPHMANFTDFDPLAAEPAVRLAYLGRPDDLSDADVAIVPGTKQTRDDLAWLRRSGFAAALEAHAVERRPIVGICGGLQMLGQQVRDPVAVEGGGVATGLALLPIATELRATKTTVNAMASWTDLQLFGQAMGPIAAHGYEIHMGETAYVGDARPFGQVHRAGGRDVVDDGAVAHDGRTSARICTDCLTRTSFATRSSVRPVPCAASRHRLTWRMWPRSATPGSTGWRRTSRRRLTWNFRRSRTPR
jgi:adenosylcobyric acid synthase